MFHFFENEFSLYCFVWLPGDCLAIDTKPMETILHEVLTSLESTNETTKTIETAVNESRQEMEKNQTILHQLYEVWANRQTDLNREQRQRINHRLQVQIIRWFWINCRSSSNPCPLPLRRRLQRSVWTHSKQNRWFWWRRRQVLHFLQSNQPFQWILSRLMLLIRMNTISRQGIEERVNSQLIDRKTNQNRNQNRNRWSSPRTDPRERLIWKPCSGFDATWRYSTIRRRVMPLQSDDIQRRN